MLGALASSGRSAEFAPEELARVGQALGPFAGRVLALLLADGSRTSLTAPPYLYRATPRQTEVSMFAGDVTR